eukprot:617326-Pelagomonas_calceolata.AAC.1
MARSSTTSPSASNASTGVGNDLLESPSSSSTAAVSTSGVFMSRMGQLWFVNLKSRECVIS